MALWSAEIKEPERLYESFKGQFPELEKELELLIKADSSGKNKLSRKELYYYIFGDKYLNTCIPHGIGSTKIVAASASNFLISGFFSSNS